MKKFLAIILICVSVCYAHSPRFGTGDAYTVDEVDDLLAAINYSFVTGNDVLTDITATELETLTDSSDADLLHSHTQYVNAVSDTLSLDLTLTGQSISGVVLPAGVDHGGLAGLTGDDHTQYTLHSLADAANDFLVASGADIYIKKTLAETGAILEGDIDHGNIQGLDTGADHSYIDQSVISGSSPTFDGTNFTGIPAGALDDTYVNVDGTVPLTANWDVGNFTLTANGLTLDGTFTDGTLSIASGSITSGVAGTFSGLITAGDLAVLDHASATTRGLNWFPTDAQNDYLQIGGAIELGLIDNPVTPGTGISYMRAIDGTNDSISIDAKGTGTINFNIFDGTGGVAIRDGVPGSGKILFVDWGVTHPVITSSSGTIGLDNEALTTTGTITAEQLTSTDDISATSDITAGQDIQADRWLEANVDETGAEGLKLWGYDSGGDSRGGVIWWYAEESVGPMHQFININRLHVWKDGEQSSGADTGSAWVGFTSGNASFANGAFTISSTGVLVAAGLTTEELTVSESNASGDTEAVIVNTALAGAGQIGSTASLLFEHVMAGRSAGKIVSTRIGAYAGAGARDSSMSFYTTLNNVDTLALTIDENQDVDVVNDFTAGTIQADNGVSGTLVLDDGATERITLVFTGGLLTSRTVATTVASLIDWTD